MCKSLEGCTELTCYVHFASPILGLVELSPGEWETSHRMTGIVSNGVMRHGDGGRVFGICTSDLAVQSP